MTSPNVLLTYYTCNTSNKKISSFLKYFKNFNKHFDWKSKVCPFYTKSAGIIIKSTKECHFDTIFEYDLHLAVQYTNLFFYREIVNKFDAWCLQIPI
jgi:hypothetical protein